MEKDFKIVENILVFVFWVKDCNFEVVLVKDCIEQIIVIKVLGRINYQEDCIKHLIVNDKLLVEVFKEIGNWMLELLSEINLDLIIF